MATALDPTRSRSMAEPPRRPAKAAKPTPMDVERLLGELSEIKAERDVHLPTWRDCIDYVQPDRNIFDGQTPGQRRTPPETYDSYPVDAAQRGIGNIVSALVPVGGDWCEATAGHLIPPRDRERVAKGLEEITQTVFDELGASNFYTEVHNAVADMMVADGNMVIDYGSPRRPVVTKAIPMNEVFPVYDMGGELRAVYREYECQVRDIRETWPAAKLSPRISALAGDKPRAKVTIVEADVRTPTGWAFVVLDPGDKTIMFERRGNDPDEPCRWVIAGLYRRAKESYHYGPAVVALPTIRSANKVEELDLKSGAKNLAPPTLIDSRSGLNQHTVRFGANAVGMFNGAAMQGSTPIMQFPPGGMPQWSEHKVDRYHQLIDAIFFATDVVPPVSESRAMTAYEVQTRKQMLLVQQGANLGRLEHSFAFAVFKRVVWLLVSHGHIDAPGFVIDGRAFKVEARGPLARAREAEKAMATLGFVSQARGALGDQMTALGLKVEDVAASAAESSPDFPAALVRDTAEREQMQRQAATIATAQAAGGDPTMVNSVLPTSGTMQ